MAIKRNAQRGFTLLELAAVAVVIAIIASIGVRYYTQAVVDGKRTSVELLANRFTTAVALLHAQWIIEGMPDFLLLDGYQIAMSPTGWPKGAMGEIPMQNDNPENPSGCYQLWHALLQNPARLMFTNPGQGIGYFLVPGENSACRYQLITQGSENFYFEYFSSNGTVETHATASY